MEAFRGYLHQMIEPPQLALSLSWIIELLTISPESSYLVEKTHFNCFYLILLVSLSLKFSSLLTKMDWHIHNTVEAAPIHLSITRSMTHAQNTEMPKLIDTSQNLILNPFPAEGLVFGGAVVNVFFLLLLLLKRYFYSLSIYSVNHQKVPCKHFQES